MCTLLMAVPRVSVQPELVQRLADVSVWKAGSAMQVTSLGSEAKLGVDFADVYAGSQLARCANTSTDRIAHTQRHLHHEMWMLTGVEFDL